MAVCCRSVFVSGLAVFVGRRGVGLSFVVLALRMMMSRLMVMVSGGMVGGGGIVMMLAARMFCRLSHVCPLPDEIAAVTSMNRQCS
jgi:hypothetical protein